MSTNSFIVLIEVTSVCVCVCVCVCMAYLCIDLDLHVSKLVQTESSEAPTIGHVPNQYRTELHKCTN